MRLFKQVGIFFLLPFVVLIDAHISQLVGSFFPHFHLASHFLFSELFGIHAGSLPEDRCRALYSTVSPHPSASTVS